MNLSGSLGSNPPLASGGTVTRAAVVRHSPAAEPSLAGGLGAVMEQERELQAATGESLRALNGHHAAATERLLRDHQVRLGANLALLEQQFEMLPPAGPRPALDGRPAPQTSVRCAAVVLQEVGPLPALVAQHLTVLKDIEALIGQHPDGQRSELIMTKVARNHEDMAWTLIALPNAVGSVSDGDHAPTEADGELLPVT